MVSFATNSTIWPAAWLSRHLLGNSLFAIRSWCVLTGAAVVYLTGIMACELGGGLFAQLLAAIAILFAPAYLAFDNFFSMNAFEPLFWLLSAWLAVRIAKGASPTLWLVFGAISGVALENKHSMLLFGFGIVSGLLLSGEWRIFRSRWIWVGGVIALAIFLPNLIWEARHGWPQVEVVRKAQIYKNLPISPWRFLGEQIALMGPLAAPVWIGGLCWFFFARGGKRFRFLSWAYLIVMSVFIAAASAAGHRRASYGPFCRTSPACRCVSALFADAAVFKIRNCGARCGASRVAATLR